MSQSPPLVSDDDQHYSTEKPPKILQDFKVQIHESIILRPMQQTERKCCFLSNLDQDFNFPTPTLHFFSANPHFPIQTLLTRLKIAIQKVLVPYDCIAGRLRHNQQLARLEIDCNGEGAGFVVASSEFSLDQIMGTGHDQLVYPINPANRQLVFESLDNFGPNRYNHNPLCIFQVTSFKCGGFSMGFTFNHLCFDGNGAKMFLDNLASQAFYEDKPLAVIPCHDRHLLAARSPPCVQFPHSELILPPSSDDHHQSNINNTDHQLDQDEEVVSKMFRICSNQINFLKDKAKPKKFTRFSVVAALIWRCKALSAASTIDHAFKTSTDHKVCTLNIAVDVRSRLNLPTSYCGNAVIYAYASSKLMEKPFSEIVGVISDRVTGLNDEYVRSTVDWYEINKLGRPNQSYFISSWWRIGFEQVVYPWGKPICILPIRTRNVCILLPSDDAGVNAVVTLPPKEMDKFQTLFYDFLKN